MIGGTLIQGRASFGGNLCNAAPSADTIPLLIALGATCKIAGPDGRREIRVEDFCTGPGTNILRPGELLASLHVPRPAENSGACYLRFIPRNEMDIAVVGVGVSVSLENGRFADVRVALASVAPVPLFVRDVGQTLTGHSVDDAGIIAAAADLARDAASPITDMRGTADYRRHLCAVLTRRALEAAVRRAEG
jgi:carbon-monoxide dehydrogenase medium subunit